MFDNTDFYLNQNLVPDTSFLETVPQYLTKVTNEGKTDFGYYLNGYLDNLKIKVTENRVNVSDSICKYYLGNNFQTLSKGDYKRAIEKISDTLHLPLNFADVTRIDFAQNLIMQYETDLYYSHLG